jgi:tetratricopeptide (TPR) repeat protein
MKVGARIAAIEEMLKIWPGHSDAAIALARYHAQKDRYEKAVEILEPVIFDLQKFWPDDLIGTGRITADWPGNKPLLTAYAYMILELAEAGDRATAKAYADDYLQFNPGDNMGIRQKAIEVYISDGEYQQALKLIMEAGDQRSAYNLYGRALLGYALKTHDMDLALKNAVESRPLVWREMNADKHRMPSQYNPAFVKYFSPEEAYNYQQVWSSLWMHNYGALAWLKKEGRKYVK